MGDNEMIGLCSVIKEQHSKKDKLNMCLIEVLPCVSVDTKENKMPMVEAPCKRTKKHKKNKSNPDLIKLDINRNPESSEQLPVYGCENRPKNYVEPIDDDEFTKVTKRNRKSKNESSKENAEKELNTDGKCDKSFKSGSMKGFCCKPCKEDNCKCDPCTVTDCAIKCCEVSEQNKDELCDKSFKSGSLNGYCCKPCKIATCVCDPCKIASCVCDPCTVKDCAIKCCKAEEKPKESVIRETEAALKRKLESTNKFILDAVNQ